MNAQPASPPSKHRMEHKWLVLIAMTGSLSMILLDQTVVTIALPSMQTEIPLSAGGVHWVVSAYVLSMAALVAVGGRLGDTFGSVSLFRLGVTLFFLASAGCGLTPVGALGEPALLACRVLQGAGAALMMPATEAIIIGAFAPLERGRAMALYVGVGQVFLAAGPIIGGFLTEFVSWRAVFWLNVPVGVAALVLIGIARPDDPHDRADRIPPGPVLALVTGMALFVYGIQEGPNLGWSSPVILAAIAVGAVVLSAFLSRQRTASRPLVDVRILTRHGLSGDLAVLALVQFALLAIVLYSSLYVQNILGFSPIAAGVSAIPLIIGIAVSAQVGGRWFDRSGVRPPVLTGLLLAAIGTALWSVSLLAFSYPLQLPGLVLTGLGFGLVQSPTNTDALSRTVASERSQASGLVQTVRQVGGALGVAVIGAVVLSFEPTGSASADPAGAASAIALGFAAAAAVLFAALIAGWRLLARERIPDSDLAG